MTRDDLQRQLISVLLQHSPQARAASWEEENDQGVPFWWEAAAFVTTARFYDHAHQLGFTKTSESCQGYVEHLTATYGVQPVGRWVQSGTVVVWAWKTRDGVKRVGFCSAPDYPTIRPGEAPCAKVWLWRQLTKDEITAAEHSPTLGERSKLTCLRHGAPMDECDCMTYPQAAAEQGQLALAQQFAEFDWGTKIKPPQREHDMDPGELDRARENMATMIADLKRNATPPVAFCPCGKEIQPNGEQLCPGCSLRQGGQSCDFCGEPATMDDPLVDHDRDHKVHSSCSHDPGLQLPPKDHVHCHACSAAGGLSAVYHQAPACPGGVPLVDDDDPVLQAAHVHEPEPEPVRPDPTPAACAESEAEPLSLPSSESLTREEAETDARVKEDEATSYAHVLYGHGDLLAFEGGAVFCCLCAFSMPKGEIAWRHQTTLGPGGYLWGHDECVLKDMLLCSDPLTEPELALFAQRRAARRPTGPVQLVTEGMQQQAEREGQISWSQQADLANVAKQKKCKTYAPCRVCGKQIKQGDLWLRRKNKSTRQRAHQACVLSALKEADHGQEATAS